MRFAWDAAKSAATLAERGFDFAFATLIFEGPTFEKEDRRRDYGERRIIAVGLAQGVHLTVAYTDRPTSRDEIERRIVSARQSNRREQRAYAKAIPQD